MDKEHLELLSLGQKLYHCGIAVEAARAEVRRLAEAGVPYDSPEMESAVQNFQKQDAQFQSLEQAYRLLRAKIEEKK